MGVDEKIFGFFYRLAQRALGAKTARGGRAEPGTPAFDAMKDELRLLACAIAERNVVLRDGPDEGAIHGALIVLPSRMRLATDATDSRRAYLARVAFDATVVRLGLSLDQPASSATERLLATLLAAPFVLAQLERELPGAHALLAELSALERASRSGVGVDCPASAALEVLVQRRCGFGQVPGGPTLGAAELAWLARAAEHEPASATELRAALAAVSPFVRAARVAPLWLWGGIDAPAPGSSARADAAERAARSRGEDLSVRARPVPRHRRRSQDAHEENPLVRSFEKVHTADSYQAGNKRWDGSDELQEHGAALDELEVTELTQTDASAEGMVRADFDIEGAASEAQAEAAPEMIVYDEWDERTRRYREAWCSVYVVPAAASVSAVQARAYVDQVLASQRHTVHELRMELLRVRNARESKRRQPDGPDVDLDALIDRYAALRSGHTGADKLYCARRRHRHDLAVFLLLDASLSTDAWVAGHRVLDVAKHALIVLGEVLGSEDVPTAIGAFSSQTRLRCCFSVLKTFEESWQAAQPRVVSVEPTGYTRIGPALRHATQLLRRAPASKRLLVLISDAKPTDYDRYEGRYGNADVRKAIAEARVEHISVFALAIDARAGAHLPSLFERGCYEVLPRPAGLARALGELYADLLR